MVNLRTHGILDYVMAALLVVSPYLFSFADVDSARRTFVSLGIVLAVYSLLTRYYYSLAKWIPIGVHMTFDVAAGIFLILAPNILHYRDSLNEGQYALHFVLGLIVVGMVSVTRPRSESEILSHSRTHVLHP